MNAYKSLVPPSVVSHSLPCKFTGSDDLIIVRGSSLLQLYKTVKTQTHVVENKDDEDNENEDLGATGEKKLLEAQDTFIGTEITLQAMREETTPKLVLVKEWPLYGQVTGIKKVNLLAHPKRDCLVISFRYGKISIVSWDAETQSISTQSLHYYEKNISDSHFFDSLFEAKLSVDPNSASATLLFQQDTLVFLPFAQDELLDESTAAPLNGVSNGLQQPNTKPLIPIFRPSFILKALDIDESISNVIDFTYLFEYRIPTIAILFEPNRTWACRLQLNKDSVCYMVLSLDLSQQTFTSILSVQNLPYSIQKLVPLKDPLGGCLLVGTNELIHIDSQGRVNGASVNPFHKISSDLELKDLSSLNIFLENAVISGLDGADEEAILVTEEGVLYKLNFVIESRKVQEILISKLPTDINVPRPTTLSLLPSRCIFIGSNTSDSKLIQWKRKGEITADDDNKTAVVFEKPTEDENENMEDDHDAIDDIYGDMDPDDSKATLKNQKKMRGAESLAPIVVRLCDTLNNYGPINDIAVCRATDSQTGNPIENQFDIVAASGVGPGRSLTVFNTKLRPAIVSRLKLRSQFSKVWAINPSGISESTQNEESDDSNVFDAFLIGSTSESTSIFRIGEDFEDITSNIPGFKSDIPTISAKVAFNSRIVILVCSKLIALYDSDMSLITETPIEKEPSLVTFADSYVVLHYENSEPSIYNIKELFENKWEIKQLQYSLSGTTYMSAATSTCFYSILSSDAKRIKRKLDEQEVKANAPSPIPVGYSTTSDSVKLFPLNSLSSSVDLTALLNLPNCLKYDDEKRAFIDCGPKLVQTQQQKPIDNTDISISQLQHFKLGNSGESEEYLAILTKTNELYVYHIIQNSYGTFIIKDRDGYNIHTLTKTKEGATSYPPKLIQYESIGEFSGLFVLGEKPMMLLKEKQSSLQYHIFDSINPVVGFTTFNTPSVFGGMAYVDSKFVLNIATLPQDFFLGLPWPAKKVDLGGPVLSLCYHDTGHVLAVSVTTESDYNALDPDDNPIPDLDLEMPRPKAYSSVLKIISPKSWTAIDEAPCTDPNESIMTMKSVFLEVSEKTKQMKEFLVIGTSIIRGEDLAASGGFYIYDVIEVVPEPGKPETNHKLKLVTSEVSKGAVTSVCEVSGHLLVAQAQKVVVRNIQEDNSVVPVAFLDMNMYVNCTKSIKYMVLLSDAIRSVWLVGFGKEPFRMTLFGKDYRDIQVTSCEFLVFDKHLYIVAADTHQRLHVLQYDPEDPQPFSGQKLIRRSEFFVGSEMNTMIMLPLAKPSKSSPTPPSVSTLVPLCGASDGSISVVLPVSESRFRALYVIQQQIADKEEHYCGLNPRMHRALGIEPANSNSQGKILIDFSLVKKFYDLPANRRALYSRRLGVSGQQQAADSIRHINEALEYL